MTLLRRRGGMSPDDHRHEEPDSGLDHDQLPHVASMGLIPVEATVLDLVRCFCHGWSGRDISAWNHAFELAEEKLGPLDGPPLVARVFALMRTLLRESRNGIRFMPLGCGRICKAEQMLMSAVQDARRGEREPVLRAVSWFFASADPVQSDMYVALRTLGAVCDRCQSGRSADAEPAPRTNRILH
jgi:hypothetical protein